MIVVLNQNATFSAIECTRWSKTSYLFIPEPTAFTGFLVDDTLHESRITAGYAKERQEDKAHGATVNPYDVFGLSSRTQLVRNTTNNDDSKSMAKDVRWKFGVGGLSEIRTVGALKKTHVPTQILSYHKSQNNPRDRIPQELKALYEKEMESNEMFSTNAINTVVPPSPTVVVRTSDKQTKGPTRTRHNYRGSIGIRQ